MRRRSPTGSAPGRAMMFHDLYFACAAALFAVGWLMQALSQLHSAGNLELECAVGCAAQVYLRIPPRGTGAGKITVTMQGRTVELNAVTTGPEIATGSAVKIVALR